MRLWADFNDIRYGKLTSTLLEFASLQREPEIGERVELYDGVEVGEGNRCEAIVTEVKDSVIYLELDWETWVPADDEEKATLLLTKGNPLTGTVFGFCFEITERFHSPQLDLTNTKITRVLQPK